MLIPYRILKKAEERDDTHLFRRAVVHHHKENIENGARL